eukprot:168394_1
MADVLLYSIQFVNYRSPNYNEVEYNQLTPWKRAGIIDFTICRVFNAELIINNIDCPSYSNGAYDATYIAIGKFGIVANNAINQYKNDVIEGVTSNMFKNIFAQNMNNRIYNITSKHTRRILSEFKIFEAIHIDVIDPLNFTVSTSTVATTKILRTVNTVAVHVLTFHSKEQNATLITIIVVISILFVITIILLMIYIKQLKKGNDDNNDKEIEMAIAPNANEGMQDNEVDRNNNCSDQDVVDMINNETHYQ